MKIRDYIVAAILLIGFFLRIHNLQNNPPGLFVDEASIGYDAYLLLTTGKDNYNVSFPVFFRSLGEFKDPVMIYSTIPFVAVFGLSEFSIRLVSAFYGIGAVIMLYLLIRKSINEQTAFWATVLLAISPWHVHFSRISFQLIAAVFWLLFGLYFLYKSFDSKKYYLFALLGWMLAFFSYSTTKMYLPILLIFFLITHWKQTRKLLSNKTIWLMNAITVSIVVALIYPYIIDGTFFARWNQVSMVRESLSVPFVLKGYLNHFSPQFLFLKGDSGFEGQIVTRHSLPGLGEIYWFQFPFILIGIIYILIHKDKKGWFYILFLLIYPLGTIFTDKIPQATRSILGVIPFQVLSAFGIVWLVSLVDDHIPRFIIHIALGVTFICCIITLGVSIQRYPLYSADYWGWQYGFGESMKYFKHEEKKYDSLQITHRFNDGQYLLNFYNVQLNCKKCISAPNPIIVGKKPRELFALRIEDVEDLKKSYPKLSFHAKKIIKLPNGKEELYIGEFKSF